MGKVREIVPILAIYRYIHEFNQLFGSKVEVTIGVAVAVL
jgi:hypothetical protein